MHYCILKCDCNGLVYTIEDHDITLNVPEGAIAKNETIHIEIDVTMYGSFIFPKNTQPISPIIWLCVLEKDTKLRKPIRLILPHFLTNLTRDQLHNHQIGFAKASHRKYTVENSERKYNSIPVILNHFLPQKGIRVMQFSSQITAVSIAFKQTECQI